jgi:hypothetical protein
LSIGPLGFVHHDLVAQLRQSIGEQAAHQAGAEHHTRNFCAHEKISWVIRG